MRLTITIDCDNAAFGNDAVDRCQQIRHILAYGHCNDPMYVGDSMKIRDSNGNTCGTVKMTRGRGSNKERWPNG